MAYERPKSIKIGLERFYDIQLFSLSFTKDVLVSTIRQAPRFSDLNKEEVSDLFISTQTVSNVIKEEYKATSLSIAIQVHHHLVYFLDFSLSYKLYGILFDVPLNGPLWKQGRTDL